MAVITLFALVLNFVMFVISIENQFPRDFYIYQFSLHANKNNATEKPDNCETIIDNTPHSLRIVDKQRGLISFRIPQPLKNCDTSYIIRLLVAQDSSKCSNVSSNSEFDLHSEIDMHFNDNLVDNNEDVHEWFVDYVFTGCYRLTIVIESSGLQRLTRPFNINTQYIMKKLENLDWLVSAAPYGIDNKILMAFEPSEIFKSVHWIQVKLRNSSHSIICYKNLFRDIEPVSDLFGLYPYPSNNELAAECHCWWSSSKAQPQCKLKKLQSENYTTEIIIQDPRCRQQSVWNKGFFRCAWIASINFTAIDSSGPVLIETDGVKLNYWVIVVVLSAFTFGFSIWFLISKLQRIKNLNDEILNHPDPNIDVVYGPKIKPKILLLYPRDCQPFMESMDCFRRLLEATECFEVYDPLDDNNLEEVASTLNIWALDLLSQPCTKIVLVSSWCSLRIYKSLLSTNSKLVYVDPEFRDNMFSFYAKQLLHENIPNRKIFIVGLMNANASLMKFEHLLHCQHFTLPQSVTILLAQLLELTPGKTVALDSEHSLLQNFEKSIKAYRDYLIQNPNYLDNLLIDVSNK